jgi:hypothetical protein
MGWLLSNDRLFCPSICWANFSGSARANCSYQDGVTIPFQGEEMAYQIIKRKHPANPELCPQIITPKTELPPPSLERREDLWVTIQLRTHARVDQRAAIQFKRHLVHLGHAPDHVQHRLCLVVLGNHRHIYAPVHNAHHVRLEVEDRRGEVFGGVRGHEPLNCFGHLKPLSNVNSP